MGQWKGEPMSSTSRKARNRSKRLLMAALAAVAFIFGALLLSRAEGYQLFGDIVDRVDVDMPLVALTFDDGPSEAGTRSILEHLASHDVRGTFFLVGDAMAQRPDATHAIAEAGHEIGNHGRTHSRMVLMRPGTLRDELDFTDAAIRASGYTGTVHFRPPYGMKLVTLPWVLSQQGRLTVMWSVDPSDALPKDASAQQIADFVVETARPGDIILMHVMFRADAAYMDAVPLIIEGLKSRGFTFVTVSDLMAAAQG